MTATFYNLPKVDSGLCFSTFNLFWMILKIQTYQLLSWKGSYLLSNRHLLFVFVDEN
ncbi:hypothetical protein HanRHA438_Chr06g0277131 [Helianthus annuus]|nr:hypothetical protein HanRHA438_Chr06g0277131 [Helianthus annuus]